MRSTIFAALAAATTMSAVQAGEFSLRKGKLMKTLTTYKNFSMTFKIKPTARRGGWGSIVHFTANNQNYRGASSRIPAVWFYSNSTRMHVRMGRPGKANDGCDPKEQLPLNKWSTFNLKLMGKTLTVSVDGKVLCVNNNYAKSDPSYKNVKVYAADPWHNAALARIKDFSYVDEDARVKKVAAAKRRARMAHLKKQRDARAKIAAAKALAIKLAKQAAADKAAREKAARELAAAKAKIAAAKAKAIRVAKAKAAKAKAIRIAKRKAAKAKAARLAREKAAREKAARLAIIRRRQLRMQRLHAEAKNDNTGRCYYGRSAYGGCEIGGKRGGNGGGHKVIKATKKNVLYGDDVHGKNLSLCQGDCDTSKDCNKGLICSQRSGYSKIPGCSGKGKKDWDYCVPKPKPTKMVIKKSSQCAAMCKAKGHCCNDYKVGSNQMVSCAQACEMRISGVSKQNCQNKVNEFASKKGQGGCRLQFGKKNVSLCNRCKDLDKTCPHGVQNGKAGLDGCAALVQ